MLFRSVPGAPEVELRGGLSFAPGKVPVAVWWRDAVDAGTGLAKTKTYRLEAKIGGGAWTTVAETTDTRIQTTLPDGASARFRVRAIDKLGNAAYSDESTLRSASVVPETTSAIKYTGTWKTAKVKAYGGGSARYTTKTGSTASYSFYGRGAAIVMAKAPGRGKVTIYLDGAKVATYSLSGPAKSSYIVWQSTWGRPGSHTVKIVSSSSDRIDFDGVIKLE